MKLSSIHREKCFNDRLSSTIKIVWNIWERIEAQFHNFLRSVRDNMSHYIKVYKNMYMYIYMCIDWYIHNILICVSYIANINIIKWC